MISEIFLGSVILSVFYIFWLYLKERKTFARLPYKWNSYPLIGNIDLLKGNPDNNGYLLFEISQKLGQPLLSFRQYGFYFVAINDYPSYKELMVEHGANTAGRMGIPKSSFINKGTMPSIPTLRRGDNTEGSNAIMSTSFALKFWSNKIIDVVIILSITLVVS